MLAAGTATSTIRLWRYYVDRLSRVLPSPDAATHDLLIAWLAHPSWQPETRRSARTAIAVFYGWAHRTGRLKDNPAANLPRIRVPDGEPRPASPEAIQEALIAADDRVTLMILLGAVSALRRAEIAGVHTYNLNGRDLYVIGKGGRGRWVDVPPDVAAVIAAHPPGWLFPSPSGDHLTPNYVGRLISRSLPPGVTPHQLRHAAASALSELGMDLFELRAFLGHASIRTTQRYVKIRRDGSAAAVLQLRDRYRKGA
jgi:integrase/recombinase XerC